MTNAGIQYDAAGNLMNDTTHSYKYDAEGNLISVDSGATAVDVYDALNRRVRVQTASAADEYIYDYANRRISTWLPNGAGIEGRIYWGSLLAAFRAQNGDTYFDQKDILGTDRLRMNYAAVSAANYTSLPFGDDYTAHVSGSYGDQDNNHFALLDRDAESDTDHAQFRQYYNMWGRWMSPDPYSGSYDITNPQSFNRYVYAMNNPLNFIDSTGLDENGNNCDIFNPCNTATGGSGDPQPGIPTLTFVGLTLIVDPGTTVTVTPGPPTYLGDYIIPNPPSIGGSIGGGVGTAPNNHGQTQKSCGGIVATGVVQTGLDALGAIPGEAVVSLTAKEALAGGQVLAAFGSTAISVASGSKTGISLGATATTFSVASVATDGMKGAAELIPGIGQGVAVVSSIYDVAATVHNYGGCKGWWGGADW